MIQPPNNESLRCACPFLDAQQCASFRYPRLDPFEDEEPCTCGCHEGDLDRFYDEDGEQPEDPAPESAPLPALQQTPTPAMRVLVCGSRHYKDAEKIRARLSKLPPGTVIIHGGAKGADTIAGEVAKELGFAVEEYPADWDKHGKAAGPIRNRQMLTEGKPDYVIAFPIGASPGTRHMINLAKQAGVRGVVVR